jgi:hypothetical protein
MGIGVGTGRGGARRGAGRPKGVKNKRRPARFRAADAERQLPLDYMMRVLNDPSQPIERRDRMAVHAAPYLHARLTAGSSPKTTFEMSDDEIRELLFRELEHARRQGNLPVVRELEECLRGDQPQRPRLAFTRN